MSILAKMSTSSSDPAIAYFSALWYEELSNEYGNLSRSTIWGLDVDFPWVYKFYTNTLFVSMKKIH